MYKRIFGVLVIVSGLLFSSLGCIATDDTVTLAQFNPVKAIADKLAAKEAIWDSYGAEITALKARPTTATFDSTALTNKDTDLQNQINALKDKNVTTSLQAQIDVLTTKVNNLTPSSIPGGTPTSDTGTVVYTNNPVAIPQIFSSSSGGNSNPWIMTIKNNSTTWQYVKPVIQLNVASGQPSSIITDVTVMISGGSCSMTGTLLVAGNFSFSPVTATTIATPSMIIMPISGCNGSGEIQVGPGQQQAFNVQIQNLKTPTAILWNVTTSISSRSM
jgi:hypothetical protein